MKNKTILILVLLFFCTLTHAQSVKNEDKIDPVFRLLLSGENTKTISANKKCVPGKRRTKGTIEKREIKGKLYDCIVYTKNAKALKDKGIVVGSTLPTFVTARVSLQQIEQLAAMDEVTYIEASKTNYSH
ncbi:hypothetical protein [Segetibacter aerophilus]|uniref:Inhibitor I9 domain-containing protein n=1 Tax=Segetibacter aerophilus TaxID=670293 RepID=A0A512B9E9_9BACT|nr:hypothetical protein [Segetibacter aerophilus]GEO08591.1 hypothetical protein SAE01_10870 [Segetibacter aerophilus]